MAKHCLCADHSSSGCGSNTRLKHKFLSVLPRLSASCHTNLPQHSQFFMRRLTSSATRFITTKSETNVDTNIMFIPLITLVYTLVLTLFTQKIRSTKIFILRDRPHSPIHDQF